MRSRSRETLCLLREEAIFEAVLVDELPPADWTEPDAETGDELARLAADVVEGMADCDFETLTEGVAVVGLADYLHGFELL